MGEVRAMLETLPTAYPLDVADVADAIEAAQVCSQSCISCVDADLFEEDVADMRVCIARCLECADLCEATVHVLSRPGGWDAFVVHHLLQACVRACASCAEECARHADHHRHCGICAKTCRACEEACTKLLEDDALAELQKLAGG
jgi:hypothetical protein